MVKRRICPVCGKPFIPRTYHHIFCNRRCFKADYRKRMNEKTFPTFTCPQCKTETELDFYPKEDSVLWGEYKCPICGYCPLETKKTN